MEISQVHDVPLQEIIEEVDEAIFVKDLDGHYLTMNSNGASLLGKTTQAIVGKTDADLFPPETASTLKAQDREVIETGKPRTFENTIRFAGKDLVFRAKMVPHRNGEGRVVGLIGIVRDITEHKQTEQEFGETFALLQGVMNNTTDLVYAKDLDGRYLMMNSAAATVLGKTPSDVLNKDDSDFFPPEDAHRVRESDLQVVEAGRAQTIEESVRVGAEERTYLSTKAPYKDRQGKVVGLVSVSHDITERKRTEEALRKKDRDIRRAYAEVFSAVTDEKLLILTDEEIGAAVGRPVTDAYSVSGFEKMSETRAFLREALSKRPSLDLESSKDTVLAASEAITNALKHGGSCEIQVYCLEETVQVRVSDPGPGIDFSALPKAALVPGFSTKGTLGVGFTIMLESCDRVLLATGPAGTTVVLETGGEGWSRSLDLFE